MTDKPGVLAQITPILGEERRQHPVDVAVGAWRHRGTGAGAPSDPGGGGHGQPGAHLGARLRPGRAGGRSGWRAKRRGDRGTHDGPSRRAGRHGRRAADRARRPHSSGGRAYSAHGRAGRSGGRSAWCGPSPRACRPAAMSPTCRCSATTHGQVYTGRAPLEALSIGVELGADDVAYRCNFVTVVDGVMRTTRPAVSAAGRPSVSSRRWPTASRAVRSSSTRASAIVTWSCGAAGSKWTAPRRTTSSTGR